MPFKPCGKTVSLIDTPGFDDTVMSDTDVLTAISIYLCGTYTEGRQLSGIIYMHRISDNRMGGISRRNFSMFRKLCGVDAFQNVMIVTNMWGGVTQAIGTARANELRTDERYFKPVLDRGARMERHDNTVQSVKRILTHLVDKDPKVLCIEKELVEEKKDLSQTQAGAELAEYSAKRMQKYLTELRELRREMKEKDTVLQAELLQLRSELEEKVRRLENERERLSEKTTQDIMFRLEIERKRRREKGFRGYLGRIVNAVLDLP